MPTVDDCMKCTKTCPQAKLAHETAKGRMYATNELLSYVKKVDSGQLVEVVRCKDCKHYEDPEKGIFENCVRNRRLVPMLPDDFCSYGERKDNEVV